MFNISYYQVGYLNFIDFKSYAKLSNIIEEQQNEPKDRYITTSRYPIK